MALVLLPPASKQYAVVAEKIESGVRAGQQSKPKPKSMSGKAAGGITAALIAIATKAKLLLLGLTKLGTISSILLSFGLYWKLWGWQFAGALLAAIYIHEIGHVAALQKRGLAASAPMFVPGFGAFVRMHEHAATPSEDARIGLAGPLWGLGAAAIAIGLYTWTHAMFWLAIVQTVGRLTLFNLTPVWQLDGSRGFHALSRAQRWLIVAAIVIAYALTREGLLVLVGLAATWRAFEKQVERANDWVAFAQFVVLVGLGAALSVVPVSSR